MFPPDLQNNAPHTKRRETIEDKPRRLHHQDCGETPEVKNMATTNCRKAAQNAGNAKETCGELCVKRGVGILLPKGKRN